MQAIETVYNGVRFRSRFEADAALLLDVMELRWEYEPISVLMDDGSHYWPDFWIDECRLWVEVRGYVDEKGERQIREFAKHLVRYSEPGSRAPDYLVIRRDRVDFFDGYYGFSWTPAPAYMLDCHCGRRSFFALNGYWRCRRCGDTGDPHGMGAVWQMEMVGGRIGARTEAGTLVTLEEMAQLRPRPQDAPRVAAGMDTVGDVLASLQGGNTGAGQALRKADVGERIRTLDSADGVA